MLIIISSFTYRAMVQAVSLKFLTAKARIQSKASLYEICDRKTDSRTDLSPTAMLNTRSFYRRCFIILVTDNVDK
jgi:hypothetical protein